MGFNYAQEERRFNDEWDKLAEQYSAAGLDAAAIQAMRDFDWEWFKQRRKYENKVQAFPSEIIENNEDGNHSTLFIKFPSLMVGFDEESFKGRYGWIDAVNNPALSRKLCKLSDADKELLTLFVFDGYSQTEIAMIQGCAQSVISRKLSRLKKYLG